MKKRKCTIHLAKTKALISFAVTAKLICALGFVYADCWFSHEAAHLFLIKDLDHHHMLVRFGTFIFYIFDYFPLQVTVQQIWSDCSCD